MDPRRSPRSVSHPKVRHVAFFAPLPDHSQSGSGAPISSVTSPTPAAPDAAASASASASISPSGNSRLRGNKEKGRIIRKAKRRMKRRKETSMDADMGNPGTDQEEVIELETSSEASSAASSEASSEASTDVGMGRPKTEQEEVIEDVLYLGGPRPKTLEPPSGSPQDAFHQLEVLPAMSILSGPPEVEEGLCLDLSLALPSTPKTGTAATTLPGVPILLGPPKTSSFSSSKIVPEMKGKGKSLCGRDFLSLPFVPETGTAAMAVDPIPARQNFPSSDLKHRFGGVRKYSRGRLAAEIRVPGKEIQRRLGTFDSAEEAAHAYDADVLYLGGPRPKTLEPPSGSPQDAFHPFRSDPAMKKAKYSADAAASSGKVTSGSDFCDVYLSFGGADTPSVFVHLLYTSLVDAGIRVFREAGELRSRDEAGRHLLGAIDSAKIYIPIFSRKYAYSVRCLQKLAAMVESKVKSSGGKTIIPIFYDVKPCDVRLETPMYHDALVNLKKKIRSNEVKAWEDALKEVGSLSGWVRGSASQGRIIEEIVKEVVVKLKASDKQVEDMMDLLDLEVSDVRIVGIWGEDGVGKTALAKVIYEKVFSQFDRCSFLADIGTTAKQLGGVQLLQSKLISDILNREYEVDQVAKGVDFFRGILRNMKVLIVLDDVEVQWHLQEIVGQKLDWLGYGSRIIVTTSIKSVLPEFISRGLAHVYGINVMNGDQALELLRKYALQRDLPIPDFDEIATDIFNSVNWIPLLIKVIGSLLSRKVVEEWTELEGLILQPGSYIEKILMASYEELSKEQREIFLDIACLPADVDCRIASFMWHNPNFPPFDEVDALHVMSLVKIGNDNELGMHRLIREFGQQIIQKEDDLYPGTKGRLGNLELAWKAKSMKGTDHLNFDARDFESMPNIRFLILDCAKVVGNFAKMFPNLKWLQWRGCTRDFEATNFHVEKLVILDLSWSKVTEDWGGWRKIKMLQLKVLNLTGCADLLVCPDLSSFPDLEILILERCSQLMKLDPSIRHLKCLTTLNLRFCDELNMLPIELGQMKALKELLIDGTSVQEIPVSMGYMKKLEIFSASNCLQLSHLPDSVCGLTALLVLSLENAKITQIPASIEKLAKLRILSLKDCCWIGKLPDSICNLGNSLEELDITGTSISELPNSIACLGHLKVLKMDSCFIRELPREIGNLFNLEELHASHCRSLKGAVPTAIESLDRLRILRLGHSSISGIPLEIGSLPCLQILDLLRCNKIQALPELPFSLTCLHVSSERMEALPDLKDLVKLEEICLGDKNPKELICPSTQMEPEFRSEGLLVVPIVLPKLKILELSHSRIGELQLGHGSLSCTHLKKLVLSGVNLKNVPKLPSSLSVLSIQHCSSLRQLPKVHCLSKLSELNLIQSAVEEIKGLQGLIALEILNIMDCEICNLNGLSQLTELRSLILSDCDSLSGLPDISNLKMLNVLVVQRCRMIHAIEGLMELTTLEDLRVSECEADSTQQVQDALKLVMERSIKS